MRMATFTLSERMYLVIHLMSGCLHYQIGYAFPQSGCLGVVCRIGALTDGWNLCTWGGTRMKRPINDEAGASAKRAAAPHTPISTGAVSASKAKGPSDCLGG
uniref:Uncharacterized protein n=1 Tax=Eutreptiella gymnastica TaxID=73025 RepID=A0A7S1NPZ4_9EUGL|mmetsp:Transcript_73781/g.130062  ORF Transcript_73781/g.130062 Transcript_73781/m.130062 type:complete len:102 (+) Transcript_73781:511-816(+)